MPNDEHMYINNNKKHFSVNLNIISIKELVVEAAKNGGSDKN